MAEIVSLAEAVRRAVHDGDTVAMEGFTHLIPFAAGHEVIRQGAATSPLIRMTPDLIYDQLIGAGCARKLIFSWGGNPGVGSLHRFRDAVEHGWPRPLEIEEHSHAGMANRYVAGAGGLPFAVLRGYNGTGLVGETATIKPITCPFTGEPLTAVAALNPDVAVIHAQRADTPRQRPALGDHRGTEGSGPFRQTFRGDRRRDRPLPRPQARRGRAPVLGSDATWRMCRAARTRPTRRTTQSATTTTTSPGTRSRGTARRSASGWRRTC